MKIKLIVIGALLLVFCITGIIQYIHFSDGKLHVIFCDVGQGDGIYIRTPGGADIVIDGGPGQAVLDCIGDHHPFWDRTIELTFLSHPHADHMEGLIELAKRYSIRSFNTEHTKADSDMVVEFDTVLSSHHIPKRWITKPDTFVTSDGVTITTLWPTKELIQEYKDLDDPNFDKNSLSLVQLLTYKDFSVLLTGDVQYDVLNDILSRYPDVDILKVSHHGSDTGTDENTLKSHHIGMAVISVGYKNRYSHPHKSVLNLLEQYNVYYKRTDINGTVEVVSDGVSNWVRTER